MMEYCTLTVYTVWYRIRPDHAQYRAEENPPQTICFMKHQDLHSRSAYRNLRTADERFCRSLGYAGTRPA